MRICIPTEDKNGAQSRVNEHFGSAPFFAIADTDSGDVQVIPNLGMHHRHGHCEPIKHLDTSRLDAIVCRGMGQNAFRSLEKSGVEVWITYADTVGDVVEDTRENRLTRLTAEAACGGHGHQHQHRHGR